MTKQELKHDDQTRERDETMTATNNTPILIALDQGYGNVKTPNFIFPTGITAYDAVPAMASERLCWAGRWYAIGDSHKEFIADKTADASYSVTCVAAINAMADSEAFVDVKRAIGGIVRDAVADVLRQIPIALLPTATDNQTDGSILSDDDFDIADEFMNSLWVMPTAVSPPISKESVVSEMASRFLCPESRGGALWPSEVSKAQQPLEVSQRLTIDSDCLQSQSVASGDEIA
ncbi:MAG: hypothetical protein ACI4OY_12065 [Aristaeellaceae bacterium]